MRSFVHAGFLLAFSVDKGGNLTNFIYPTSTCSLFSPNVIMAKFSKDAFLFFTTCGSMWMNDALIYKSELLHTISMLCSVLYKIILMNLCNLKDIFYTEFLEWCQRYYSLFQFVWKRCGVGVTCIDMTLILNLVNIYQLVPKLLQRTLPSFLELSECLPFWKLFKWKLLLSVFCSGANALLRHG